MAIAKITTSGTFNLKSMAGYIRGISVPAAGTGWTLQLNDVGANPASNTQTVYGATPGAITTSLGLLEPLFFGNGIQVITAGATPGELDIDWI